MPFLGERHQNIFMVSWTCRRALLNWPTLRSGGVFRLRGATAISQQARAAEGLLGKMSSRSILEGELLWQDLAVMHPPGARRWQNAREMRSLGVRQWQVFRCDAFSGVQSWRDYAVVRFRAAIRGSFFASCVPEGPRTGKAPLPGNISPPCIRNEPALARYSRHASEKRRKQPSENTPREDLAMKGPLSLCVPLRSCTARRSCHSWVLRLSALIFLGWGGGGARGSRTAPRFVRVARLFRGLAHKQLLLARSPVVASATRPNW